MRRNIRRILYAFIVAMRIIKIFKNWLMVLLQCSGFLSIGLFKIDPYIVHTLRNGVKFKVRTKEREDATIITSIWTGGYHSLSEENIKDDNTVIDIGAHIGVFSVLAATLASNAKVYAYEPERENFELLQDNIKLNGLEKHVTSFNLAVVGTAEDQKRKLHIGYRAVDHSLMPKTLWDGTHSATRNDYIVVECSTLEDIFRHNRIEECYFLKINCEGSEYEILLNTSEECLKKIRKMRVEYHESPGLEYNRDDLVNFLTSVGFRVMLKPPTGLSRGYIYAQRTL